MTNNNNNIVKVMIVDDSAVIRGMVTRFLSRNKNIEIVAAVIDGQKAVDKIKTIDVDIVLLDIEMPIMDGITALPLLLAASPETKIIMNSSLTLKGAGVSMKALSLGASDYIAKPSSMGGSGKELEDFFRDVTDKILALSGIDITLKPAENLAPSAAATTNTIGPDKVPVAKLTAYKPFATAPKATATKPDISTNIARRTKPTVIPQALAIASSTGGPQALLDLFKQLGNKITRAPIFITQHMPPRFTTVLAQNIAKVSDAICVEGEDGMIVKAGNIYVAPGDYHMVFKRKDNNVVISLNQDEKVNFCRPAADPMIESLAEIYGRNLLLTVLTGMGHDGLAGAGKVQESGGTVVAQDKATSVVWGMPGAVVENNLHNIELPFDGIAPYLLDVFAAM